MDLILLRHLKADLLQELAKLRKLGEQHTFKYLNLARQLEAVEEQIKAQLN